VAVVGAGAVGAYYGKRLGEGGADVTLIARGRHLEAIRTDGLTIVEPEGRRRPASRPPTTPRRSGRSTSSSSA
jgi:2-dehydropantoate 2-reductase